MYHGENLGLLIKQRIALRGFNKIISALFGHHAMTTGSWIVRLVSLDCRRGYDEQRDAGGSVTFR